MRKTLTQNTIKCDRCEKPIKDKEKSYCFHSEDTEVYICAPCVTEVFKEFVENEKNA